MQSAFGVEHGDISKVSPTLAGVGIGSVIGIAANAGIRRHRNKKTGKQVTARQQYGAMYNKKALVAGTKHPIAHSRANFSGKKAWNG